MRMDRFIRCLAHPITEYRVSKAKAKHRKIHPECAVCGCIKLIGRKNDVHHKIPVHIAPERACDPENLVTLCRVHHFIIGHLRNWKNWNKQVRETIHIVRQVYEHFVAGWNETDISNFCCKN